MRDKRLEPRGRPTPFSLSLSSPLLCYQLQMEEGRKEKIYNVFRLTTRDRQQQQQPAAAVVVAAAARHYKAIKL